MIPPVIPPSGRVHWYTESGERLARIKSRYVIHTELNPWNPETIRRYKERMRVGEPILVPKGDVGRVDLIDVRETRSRPDDYSHEPWTTGDEELDEYLVDREQGGEVDWDMEERARQADREHWGDLGEITVYLRDGNHRAAAAIELGESSVLVLPTDYSDLSALQEVLV